jgi:FixJ family two-component response regulator
VNAGEYLIVIIDDDEGICRALTRMLEAAGHLVRAYQHADEFLAEADTLEAACILADIRMPQLDGIALSRALKAAGSEAPIIFMTATGDVHTVVDAMKQGAIDLLPKPFTSEALLGAINAAVRVGESTEESHRTLAALWQLAGLLTPREAEVCALVACGLPNKNVAARIGTTEKTVKVHRGRVMRKLGRSSLADLVRAVDGLLVEKERARMHLDGIDMRRPTSVDIIVRTVQGMRTSSAVTGTNGVSPMA